MEDVIIIGAGSAGLAAAYQLLKNTEIKSIIIEESEFIGGISRTAVYNNNRSKRFTSFLSTTSGVKSKFVGKPTH